MKIFLSVLGFMTDNVQACLLLEIGGGGLWQESWYIFHSLKDVY